MHIQRIGMQTSNIIEAISKEVNVRVCLTMNNNPMNNIKIKLAIVSKLVCVFITVVHSTQLDHNFQKHIGHHLRIL